MQRDIEEKPVIIVSLGGHSERIGIYLLKVTYFRCIAKKHKSPANEILTFWNADFLGQRNSGTVVILVNYNHCQCG